MSSRGRSRFHSYSPERMPVARRKSRSRSPYPRAKFTNFDCDRYSNSGLGNLATVGNYESRTHSCRYARYYTTDRLHRWECTYCKNTNSTTFDCLKCGYPHLSLRDAPAPTVQYHGPYAENSLKNLPRLATGIDAPLATSSVSSIPSYAQSTFPVDSDRPTGQYTQLFNVIGKEAFVEIQLDKLSDMKYTHQVRQCIAEDILAKYYPQKVNFDERLALINVMMKPLTEDSKMAHLVQVLCHDHLKLSPNDLVDVWHFASKAKCQGRNRGNRRNRGGAVPTAAP